MHPVTGIIILVGLTAFLAYQIVALIRDIKEKRAKRTSAKDGESNQEE